MDKLELFKSLYKPFMKHWTLASGEKYAYGSGNCPLPKNNAVKHRWSIDLVHGSRLCYNCRELITAYHFALTHFGNPDLYEKYDYDVPDHRKLIKYDCKMKKSKYLRVRHNMNKNKR